MSIKYIAIFSAFFLILSVPTHIALAGISSPDIDTDIDEEMRATQSRISMAPLLEDYNAIPIMVEQLETPKMIMNAFFGNMSLREQLTEFFNQDPVSQISTVFDVGKSLYKDVQLLKFAHKILFSPREDSQDAPANLQKNLKSQSLSEKIEASLAKIGPKSIFDFQTIE